MRNITPLNGHSNTKLSKAIFQRGCRVMIVGLVAIGTFGLTVDALAWAIQEDANSDSSETQESTDENAPAEVEVMDHWTTDIDAAIKSATKNDLDLMLLFTGSDWCPPCIQLEKQILSKEGFLEPAKKQFVLVILDFPQNTPLAPGLEEQNNEWATRFGVEGFPTVVLLDKDQKPFAFTGFRDEGPTEYIAHINELQTARKTRDTFLKKAADTTGIERAGLLDQALSAIDKNIVEVYYGDLVEEIGELDKDDTAGLRTKYFAQRDREMRKAVMSSIAMVARLRKPDEAVVFIDEMLGQHKLPVEMLMTANGTKLRLLRQLDRVDDANILSDQMIANTELDSDSRQRLVINKAYYLSSLKKTDDAFAELDKHISGNPENLLLTIAKGELHDSLNQFEAAVMAYDKAMPAAASSPTVMADIVGAKADAQVALKQIEQALKTLDLVVADESLDGKLRAEALLHKALILREDGRRRAAILSENRAVEIVEDVNQKAEIQKLVDQFRRKFEKEVSGNG